MDIPAANCVIRFDAVTTPVSLVQSRGRARQADSSFVILNEAEGRSIQSLERAEHAQHEAISTLKSNDDDSREMILIKRKRAQESRRSTARPLLVAFTQGINKQPPLATLWRGIWRGRGKHGETSAGVHYQSTTHAIRCGCSGRQGRRTHQEGSPTASRETVTG